MNLKGAGTALLGFAGLVGLFAFDQWLFSKWIGTAYWRWYLTNGTLIGLITPIVFKAWGDLADKHTGLLSPHPFVYLASCIQVVGLPIYGLGTQIKGTQGRSSWFDYPLTWVWVLILLASILVWFVVVVPIQYVVYLVCGAPIRFMLGSSRVPIARLAGTQLLPQEIDSRETVPEGWVNVSISKNPVSMTNVLSALLFGILRAYFH
ncbi:MAG: hypothetical protein ND895_01485 [Pyrinomonadaceae bacterium]|nr:hypothetical protein [Pyrinomonadaceae bacterium]